MDVAVIGVGLIGSGALRALAADGVTCVGIGPAEPPVFAEHDGVFASHYDSGRITRHLDPVYEWALLAQRALATYGQLEADSGIAFHHPSGAVLAELDAARVAAIDEVATRLGVTTTTTADARLALPHDATIRAEGAPAGHVDPRRMLRANLAAAANDGATHLATEAIGVERTAGGWTVRCADGTSVDAERVLVATGAHTDELGLGDLVGTTLPAFDVRGETVIMATLDPEEQERLAGLPSVLARLHDGPYADLYQVPPTPYPDGTVRLKLGATRREYRRVDDGAERRAWMRGDEHLTELEPLRALMEGLNPGLRASSWETKPCLITETASGLPVVDHLDPERAPNLVLAAGGNGYAAKSANAIGALAARLVVDGRWTDAQLAASSFSVTANR